MSKVDILRLDSTTANDTAATTTINQNFKKLQDAVENTLSRDGTTPNFMDANLDMNSKRIINVGNPVDDHDVISKKYFEDTIGDAASYATQAQASANAAASSAQAASVSAANALTSSTAAESSADLAKDWATKLGDTVDGVEYSSKYYAQVSEDAEENASIWAEGTDLEVQAIGGTHSAKGWVNVLGTVYKPKGSIAFASLPTLSADIEGFVYNVTDDFITTTDFVEGAGKSYPAGTNVVCVNTGSSVYKWDILGSFIDLSGKQDVLVSGTNIKTINNNSILGSGNLQIDSLPSQTGHGGEYLTTDGTDASWAAISSTYHPTLFSWEWSDCLKNDVQWLRADTFSWQDGSVYEAAYQHLVDDIDGKTAQTETVEGVTVTFYLADDGHKIVDVANISAVESLYTATGVAWYYIIDTVNEKFKLPRAKHNKYEAIIKVGGNGKQIGYTLDGTTTSGGKINTYTGAGITGIMSTEYGASLPSSTGTAREIYADSGKNYGITTDFDNSGIIAQQAEDADQYKYLYFYVGSFTQTAIENTAGLNAELFNDKADIDLSNAVNNVSATAKATIIGWAIPDYANGITLTSSDFPYTAPSDGLLYQAASDCTMAVNGAEAIYNGTAGGASAIIGKGDIVTITAGSFVRCYFYPLKGA